MKEKYYFRCVDCGAEYDPEEIIYLCPACRKEQKPGDPPAGILKTVFNYQSILKNLKGRDLFSNLQQESFMPLLPLRNAGSWPGLRIGDTPLYQIDQAVASGGRHGGHSPSFNLYLKDDSQNPTFSFKDRASALVSAWARERGIRTIVAASTGNAGSSIAGICAVQKQKAVVIVPAGAPLAKLTQIVMYGARIIRVKGTYDNAYDLSVAVTEEYGVYNRNTAYNPLTIEGKKTVAFEIFGRMNRVPGKIFVPVGDGVILAGVYRGFEDLLNLGLIERMPVVVAVQAAGSSNLIDNLHSDLFRTTPSVTMADSISVDIPRCFNMASGYLKKFNGETVKVTDDEILNASRMVAGTAGIFTEPASAAAFAGMLKFRDEGTIHEGSDVVVLLTGSGLKDLASVQPGLNLPEPVAPELASVSPEEFVHSS